MKTILELNNEEAKQYFLKQESYCNIQLPQYYDFQPLLDALAKTKSLNGNLTLREAKKFDDVNYKFLTNKDGKYAWRSLQLIHPAMYVLLVNKITDKTKWGYIIKRFQQLQENKKIECCSMPTVTIQNTDFDVAEAITNWWQRVEQQSLELALHYDCYMNTDIADCYGSIYTHSIPWALYRKEKAKANRNNTLIGNAIDITIQSMQYGQTNGIPQGSVLMDFIAEMVLGYGDEVLSNKISEYNKEEKHKIEDYKILRYRDDYRIFATNQETLVKIAKLLTETLIDLNLKLNTQKTFISDNIVRDTIKPDKLYWNEAKQGEKTLQKHLFLIHSLAEKHPNSGSLSRALDKFLDRIYPLKLFKEENTKVLVSILVDIAYNNPRTYPVVTAILSKILSLETDKKVIEEVLGAIKRKFDKIPNVGHLQIWLQRLTLKTKPKEEYPESLCKKVTNENEQLWNVDWLNDTIKGIFTAQSIIDREKIDEMPHTIDPKEVKVFDNQY